MRDKIPVLPRRRRTSSYSASPRPAAKGKTTNRPSKKVLVPSAGTEITTVPNPMSAGGESGETTGTGQPQKKTEKANVFRKQVNLCWQQKMRQINKFKK